MLSLNSIDELKNYWYSKQEKNEKLQNHDEKIKNKQRE